MIMNSLPESIYYTTSVGDKKKGGRLGLRPCLCHPTYKAELSSGVFQRGTFAQDLSKINGGVGSGEKQTDGLTLQ